MRIDFDTRTTLAFIGAWGVIIGECFVGALGGHVDHAVIATAGTILLATLGAGAFLGRAKDATHDGAKDDTEEKD